MFTLAIIAATVISSLCQSDSAVTYKSYVVYMITMNSHFVICDIRLYTIEHTEREFTLERRLRSSHIDDLNRTEQHTATSDHTQ